jgi:hypothetical protein
MDPNASPVLHTWTKGRFYPLTLAVLLLACAAVVGVLPRLLGSAIFIAVVAIVPIIVAFRRRTVLTIDTIIVRTLFTTRAVALREIIEVTYEYNSFTRGDLIHLFFGHLFDLPTVRIKLPMYKSVNTMSLGRGFREGIRVITEAAVAAGAQL